jgi:hypothetical protein
VAENFLHLVHRRALGDQQAHGRGSEKELAELGVLAKRSYVPAVYSAFIYVALDDLDRAFESLHKACDERSSYLIFLNVQPFFEKLRADPRYRDLSGRLKLV